MALYIPHSIFHSARLLYDRPETFGPYYVYALPALLILLGYEAKDSVLPGYSAVTTGKQIPIVRKVALSPN